jgi:hypothetical protein
MSRTQARGKRNRKTGEVITVGRISYEEMQAWLRARGVMLHGALFHLRGFGSLVDCHPSKAARRVRFSQPAPFCSLPLAAMRADLHSDNTGSSPVGSTNTGEWRSGSATHFECEGRWFDPILACQFFMPTYICFDRQSAVSVCGGDGILMVSKVMRNWLEATLVEVCARS